LEKHTQSVNQDFRKISQDGKQSRKFKMIKLESLLNENNAVIKKQSIQLVKDMVKFKGKLNQYQMADIKKLLTLLKKIK
jgi:hypothetical protein